MIKIIDQSTHRSIEQTINQTIAHTTNQTANKPNDQINIHLNIKHNATISFNKQPTLKTQTSNPSNIQANNRTTRSGKTQSTNE